MAEPIHVGLDCSDRELQAACSEGGKIRQLPLPVEVREPAIVFDSLANISTIGVGFPGLLMCVGNRRNLGSHYADASPESLVTSRLQTTRELLVATSGASVGECVVAVPGSFSQGRRTALLECATAAGFGRLSLIDKCTAAALGFHGGSERAMTILVLDLGYAGAEFALARLSRGHCRVVASGAEPRVGDEYLDALIMEEMLLALRRENIFLGLKQWSAAEWLAFRSLAETARGTLDHEPEASLILNPQLTHLRQPLHLQLRAGPYLRRLRTMLQPVNEAIQAALDQHGLELSDLDAFLLTGSGGRARSTAAILAETLTLTPRIAGTPLVLIGATRMASQRGNAAISEEREPSAATINELAVPPWMQEAIASIASDESPVARVVSGSGILAVPGAPGGGTMPCLDPTPGNVRTLLEAGEVEEAAALLAQLQQLTTQLQEDIEREARNEPKRTLRKARSKLEAGDYPGAVALSHQAYSLAPDDPGVFEGMMKIHAEAGLRMDRPEDYNAALRILQCAFGHDQTDRSIHKALGERHYLHATAMLKLNNSTGAIDAIQAALTHDPKHPGANQLLRELTSGD